MGKWPTRVDEAKDRRKKNSSEGKEGYRIAAVKSSLYHWNYFTLQFNYAVVVLAAFQVFDFELGPADPPHSPHLTLWHDDPLPLLWELLAVFVFVLRRPASRVKQSIEGWRERRVLWAFVRWQIRCRWRLLTNSRQGCWKRFHRLLIVARVEEKWASRDVNPL
jgi:hypothetical protein